MTPARTDILAAIRKSLGRDALDSTQRKPLVERMTRHARHIIPERVNLDPAGLVDLFVRKAEGVAATLDHVPAPDQAENAIARYLARENLPSRLVAAPAVRDLHITWASVPTLEVRTGPADRGDLASVTVAMAGIAETGTLVLLSGPATPTGLNFVPPHNIVLLQTCNIVACAEDAWDLIRTDGLPRAVNFITGPSRTGDIEQKIEIGVHGPLRLHIIMMD